MSRKEARKLNGANIKINNTSYVSNKEHQKQMRVRVDMLFPGLLIPGKNN